MSGPRPARTRGKRTPESAGLKRICRCLQTSRGSAIRVKRSSGPVRAGLLAGASRPFAPATTSADHRRQRDVCAPSARPDRVGDVGSSNISISTQGGAMAQSSSSFSRRITRAAGLAAAGVLVAAAQASADDGQILREHAPNAIPESYIVVLDDDDASRAETAGRDRLARPTSTTPKVEHRYVNTVRGFSADDDARAGAGAVHGPGRRLRRAGPDVSRRWTPRRPRRPGAWTASTSATCRSTTPTPTRTPAPASRAYIIDTGIRDHPQRLRRARGLGHQHHRRRQRHRLQRARHARRRHGRRRRRTAWPRASRWSPSRCSTAPAAAPPRASSRASTGSPATTSRASRRSRT